jgi:pyruvate-formate lyase-activating enzyme
LHVLLDTSGYADEQDFRRGPTLRPGVLSTWLIDEQLHQRYTRRSNLPIWNNLRPSKMGKPFVVRVPLVPW